MSPIVKFLIVAWGIAQFVHSFDKSLVEISKNKLALFWTIGHDGKTTRRYIKTLHDWDDCNHVSVYNETVARGYTFDLQHVYDIRAIWIKLPKRVTKLKGLDIDILIDDTVCRKFKIGKIKSDGVSVKLNCNVSSGRLITVKPKNFDICHLKLISCNNGKTGRTCKQRCRGTYGLSCSLPCSCEGGAKCSSEDGICKTGCKNSERTTRYSNCFFNSVATSPKSMYDDVTHGAALSTSSEDSYNQLSKECSVLYLHSTTGRLYVWIEYKFETNQYIKAIDGDFGKVQFTSLVLLSITVDGSYCFEGKLIPTSQKRFHCFPTAGYGKSVRLMFTVNEVIDFRNEAISLCDLKLLTCHAGFYGPFCRLPCNCLKLPCHPETGRCEKDRCAPGFHGPNCAEADIAKRARYSISDGTIDEIPKLFQNGPKALPNTTSPGSLSQFMVRTMDLQQTYHINRLTIKLDDDVVGDVSNVSVYLRTAPNAMIVTANTSAVAYSGAGSDELTGIPCVGSMPGTNVLHNARWEMDCQGPAAIVNAVVFSRNRLTKHAIRNVAIWTCRDGTYGERCEKLCNCRYPEDVCHFKTGKCPLGCPLGFGGVDCQTQICPKNKCQMDCSSGATCKPRCLLGWIGPACNTPCPDGFFGERCRDVCFWCLRVLGDRSCHPNNGSCVIGCKSIYRHKLPQCDQKFPISLISMKDPGESYKHFNDEFPVIHATNVAIIAFYTFIAAMIFSLYVVAMCSFKQQKKKTDEQSDHGVGMVTSKAILFTSIAEGWKWVESVNKQTGYYFGFDSDEQGLTHMQKVAIWILSQDFESEISRRKDEFAAGKLDNIDKGDSSTPNDRGHDSDEEEIHELYDVL